MFDKLGVSCKEILKTNDISTNFDGIILPGAESTAIGKLLKALGMFGKIQAMIQQGRPAFGTCAGVILLACKIENESKTYININVVRNAYGRQIGSFNMKSTFGTSDEIEIHL